MKLRFKKGDKVLYNMQSNDSYYRRPIEAVVIDHRDKYVYISIQGGLTPLRKRVSPANLVHRPYDHPVDLIGC